MNPGGRLPDFLLIGATKCGTESLHRYLCEHSEVYMHPRKELRFFTEEHSWRRGLDWYRSRFSESGSARSIGEASNSYTRHPVYAGAAERIARILPDVKLVYVIRHPLKRIESHYRHRLVTGNEWRRPEAAIRTDPSYIAASRYGFQLEQYLRLFPSDRILTLRLERLIADPEPSLRRLCRFLGVSEVVEGGLPRVNVTSERVVAPAFIRMLARFPATRGVRGAVTRLSRKAGLDRLAAKASEPPFSLSPEMRDELAGLFLEDRELLSRLLGERFDDWDLDGRSPGGPGPDREPAPSLGETT